MSHLRTMVVVRSPDICLIPATFVLALTLSSPSFIPLVLLLALLLTYTQLIIQRPRKLSPALFLWLILTLAISFAYVLPSLHALSTPWISLISLAIISAMSSAMALLYIGLDAFFRARTDARWMQLTLFPTIWATGWWTVAYFSPFGRLGTWSPVFGVDWYTWVLPVLGPVAVDWVVAAWAVLCSQAMSNWFFGPTAAEPPLIPHELPEDDLEQWTAQNWLLAIILILLAAPPFITSDLPNRPFSERTTPLTVGCVLPPSRLGKLTPTLDDFISESKKLTKAKILLWPEGAVRFDSAVEKQKALERVRQEVRGPYVGVAFEDFEHLDSVPGRGGIRRTGVAIVSNDSERTHLLYYKRKLVPIAESFSLTPSSDPPSIFTLDLPPPSGTAKTDWAPGPNHTRPIPLTASICLDFAQLAAFAALESRPSLILAPARTWHTSVGVAMWNQAKSRAEELGSMVLWCDGGEGGVSGIAGDGMHEISQSGQGSWTRTIGIQWPFQDSQTIYASIGDLTVLVIFWAVLGASQFQRAISTTESVRMAIVRRTRESVQYVKSFVDRWQNKRVRQGENQPLLL